MTPEERNYVSLKEHFETRITALERATDTATKTLDKRLDSMNEFRNTLKDQAGTFVTRSDLKKIESDIEDLNNWKSRQEGKASQLYVTITLVIALIGIFISLIGILKGT